MPLGIIQVKCMIEVLQTIIVAMQVAINHMLEIDYHPHLVRGTGPESQEIIAVLQLKDMAQDLITGIHLRLKEQQLMSRMTGAK